jgi:chemotaxis protein MotB
MAKSACKCKPTECEECPEWIFTFADLVMLMMGFFVILWVLKPNPGKQQAEEKPTTQASDQSAEGRWLDQVGEIRNAFGWLPDPASTDPVDIRRLRKSEHADSPTKDSGKGGETQEPKQGVEGSDPLVMNVRPGQHVTVGGKLLFDPGDARLTPETTRTLDEIYRLIKGHRNIVLVKGHSALDDIQERAGLNESARSQQQMDLSLRRAQAAANCLIELGLSPDVVRVQGCSTYEPVVQKIYTHDGQLLNRRVEIEVTDILVPQRQDRAAPTTVPEFPATQPSSGPN